MATDERAPLLRSQENEEIIDEPTGCGATKACDPRGRVHKFLVLGLMVFLSFGSYFCYDNPAALQDTMKEALNIDTATFMSFYAWYSWPNVILCFFGGFFIDSYFGVRLGGIIFAGLVTIGQVVFALGALINNIPVMYLGRFIFGVGGESLCVAQNTYAARWFSDSELFMVFGLQLSFSRVGSTVNMNVMQPLYDWVASFSDGPGHVALGISLFVATSFCIFSLLCAFGMAFFDKRKEKYVKGEQKNQLPVKITDVKDFGTPVWCLCLICVFYYVSVFPFIGLGMVFFEMKYQMSAVAADSVNSLVYIISAVASPVFGFCIDQTGFNIFWVIAGIIITLGCHGIMAFTFLNPYIPMVTMGLSYSILAAALWPLVSWVVNGNQLGTAFGVMQAVQNLGLGLVSIIAGKIVDSAGYLVLEVFFCGCLCIALVSAVVLYFVNLSRGGTLNLSAARRKQLNESLKEEHRKIQEAQMQNPVDPILA